MSNETSHTTRCFVSHSHEDKNFVRQLVVDLKREGLDIFFDEYENWDSAGRLLCNRASLWSALEENQHAANEPREALEL